MPCDEPIEKIGLTDRRSVGAIAVAALAVEAGVVSTVGILRRILAPAARTEENASTALRGTARQRATLAEHEKKLGDYRANPYANDNKNFLRNAPNAEVRERIIRSRIKHLEDEIRAIRKAIDETQR